jgi:hippurate hydrolase
MPRGVDPPRKGDALTTAAAWGEFYQDLHLHPELSFQETRTAGLVAEQLAAFGFDVTTGVGRTGVVGLLHNGEGPVVLLRADMDALPVREVTGLPYASTQRGTDPDGNDVPVMHACGHDVHVTCLLAACERLAAERDTWAGTILAVFQPAEELGAGAQAMVDDGLFARFPTPDVVLGQHVVPLPGGIIGLHAGPAYAATDTVRIVLHGRGGHGSMPDSTVDPVVMAAATVMRLQTIVAREVAAADFAVVTVGRLSAGTKANIIPDDAEILVNVRTYSEAVRTRVLAAIERIARGEAAAAGAPAEPDIERFESLPTVINDPEALEHVRPALAAACASIVDHGSIAGSEDVGLLAISAGAPCVYWALGGADPALFAGLATFEEVAGVVRTLPSNHSPLFAPAIEPTLTVGTAALVNAARAWLGPVDPAR